MGILCRPHGSCRTAQATSEGRPGLSQAPPRGRGWWRRQSEVEADALMASSGPAREWGWGSEGGGNQGRGAKPGRGADKTIRLCQWPSTTPCVGAAPKGPLGRATWAA